MRLAVISDVHGNSLALEAVLADIAGQGADATLNLGDHVSGPLWPAETAAILMAQDFPSIQGNHDRALLGDPGKMKKTDRYADARIGEAERDWLRSLPATRLFEGEVFLAHGTPRSDKTYWLEEAHADGHMKPRPLEEVEAEAEGFDFPVLLCGHSHIQRLVMLADGRLIINPGSVGCPAYRDTKPYKHNMSSGSPHARYAILDRTNGVWTASFRAVPYDHMQASDLARANDRLDWAEGLATGWIR